MSEKMIYEMTPQQAATACGVTLEELRTYGLQSYLIADPRRTEAGFKSLWSKWSRGKSNMPLAVEGVTDKKDRDTIDYYNKLRSLA